MQIELIIKVGKVYGQLLHIKECYQVRTAMIILERLGIQTSSSFDRSVCLNLKPISNVVGVDMAWFLSKNYWS